ncbi:MAG: type II toxin-antitoxin system VapC family toxin [Candidatus Sulfotelmatobacter sp.]
MSPGAFWDTSALVPLCVLQPTTASALALRKQFEIVVWWATEVEVTSALARLLRMNVLPSLDWRQAHKTAAELAQSWTVVKPSSALRSKAQQIVMNFDLRAGDALQLAAALEWCADSPGGRSFLTADLRLYDAALLSGFDARSLERGI